MTEISNHLSDLARFIQASPSSYHAVTEVAARLIEAGFVELNEADEWPTGPDKRFVVRDGAVIAWIEPATATATTPFRIVGSHTDSPGFKLKPKPTTGNVGWIQAGVEVYGGPLLNSWLDRELEFAGRLVFRDGTSALVRTGPYLRFPQLAVHLDRGVNANGLVLDPQRHMNPVIGVGNAAGADVVAHLASLAGRTGDEVTGYDVMVADTAAPATFGMDAQFFASGRLDNLSSVHSSLVALLRLGTELDHYPVFAAFDHEELGSETRSGASGPFLADVLARISAGNGASEAQRLQAYASSWCLSADVGHSIHPNYPERHDPVNHPIVGGGPLLKINANQRYATDALGAAEWVRACEQAGVPFQEFVSNNTVPCGSTIGPLTATRLGIRTIDVGMPVLSMHSAREMCAATDTAVFTAAIQAFLEPVN
ncbi:M18 family aminopeptidase [Glaciihabitans sp. dw_435]|uniref:M18 family aminopeptidase n=1 Tax=Glaciihabitans sp. dw_435 TaxID=2720081 RepID=UPI001BD29363|nr:M18 family aminopeptidase [Glaciihabitans sp. dw_435]